MDLECCICFSFLSEPADVKSQPKEEEPPAKRSRSSQSQGRKRSQGKGPSQPSGNSPTSSLTAQLRVTKCGHVFHKTCIEDWIKLNPVCPNCRKPLDPRELGVVYLPTAAEDKMCKSCKETGRQMKEMKLKMNAEKATLLKEASAREDAFKKEIEKLKKAATAKGRNSKPSAQLDRVTPQQNELNELQERHRLLMSDYEALQKKLREEEEKADILKGKNASLEEKKNWRSNPRRGRSAGGRRESQRTIILSDSDSD